MAERNVLVRLLANVADFKTQMQQAERSVKGVGDQSEKSSRQASTTLGRLTESAQKNRAAWNDAGTAMTAFGAVTVLALGATVKAAVDWESAWTGVLKTVDGTEQELAGVEKGLRGLARTLPSTHGEIAAVAEAAGQLGVKTESIVAFTRTMVDLGETTNLSAEEAATSIAQMMNVMRTAPEDVGRLGATLVALGNAGASTEKQLIEMSQRIAGAAAVVGLSEADVLAFSNAVASMGIEVESGGTSVSRVLTDMSKAAQSGGAELEVFAETAGMSADKFSRAFLEDPAEAFAAFIEGLGGVQEAGGNVFAILEDLGLSDVRVSQALLGMASSGDLLRESLDLGAVAWEENTALVEEAAKRYDTTAAKLEMARNGITDAAIEIGDTFLPVLADMSEGVADVAGAFADLPDPVKATVGGLAGVAGVGALAGGAFLLMFPRVIDTYQAFRTLRDVSPGTASALSRVGKAAGIAGLLAAAAAAMNALNNSMRDAPPTMEETAAALLDLGTSTEALDQLFTVKTQNLAKGGWSDKVVSEINGIEDAARRLTDPSFYDQVDDFFGSLAFGSDAHKHGSEARTQLIDQLDQTGKLLASWVESGNAELAARQFEGMVEGWERGGGTLEELRELMPAYEEALAGVDNEQKVAAESARGLTEGLIGLPVAAGAASTAIAFIGDTSNMTAEQIEEAVKAVQAWHDHMAGIAAAFVEPLSVYQGLLEEKTASERAAAEETAAATEDSSDSWADYVGDVRVSLAEYATKLEEQITAQETWRADLVKVAGWAGADVAQILFEMGADGIQITADMADGTSAEAQRMAEMLRRDAQFAGAGVIQEFDAAWKIANIVARDGAQATAHSIATELGLGVDQVARIAAEYGLELARGVDPLLEALGKPGTAARMAGVQARARQLGLADGGLVDFYAGGGMRENHVAQIAPAGAWRVWAEPETEGEAYIPFAASKRARSVDIWRQVGDRLGVQFQEFAFGGINEVPGPPSTAPYRPPISTAGDAVMERAYGDTVDWLKENLAPQLGPGVGWQAMMAALHTEFPGLALHSGFRPGSITATGNLSYHALGRAVDVPPRMDVFNWIAENYPHSRELIFSPAGGRQIWNGRRHLYGEPTRGDHWDHNHWALKLGAILDFFRDGAVLDKPGSLFNPHVRDAGGPLLPGYTFNGTGAPETVLSNQRFFDSGGNAPVVVVREPAGGSLIGEVTMQFPQGTSPREAMHELEHSLRVADRGGVYVGVGG